MSQIYLALPYSGQEEKAYMVANRVAGLLMEDGHIVFSPISHSHSIGVHRNDFDFWMAQDLPWLETCDKLMVLKNEGWEESRGVQRELQVAEQLCLPVEYIDPMPTLIGLCAPYPHAGKSTLAENLSRAWNYERMAFAEPLTWMLEIVTCFRGANDAPKEDPCPALWGHSPRDLKRTLGTEWGRNMVHPDIWLDIMRDRIASQDGIYDGVVIDDVRFDNEAEYIKRAGGVIIRLERPEADGEVGLTHASDKSLTVEPDFVFRVCETPEQTLGMVERRLLGL